MKDTNILAEDKKNTYYMFIEFFAPHAGWITIQAGSEDEAKDIATKGMSTVKELKILEITTDPPTFDDMDEDDEDEPAVEPEKLN
jgi:hypothetical protein